MSRTRQNEAKISSPVFKVPLNWSNRQKSSTLASLLKRDPKNVKRVLFQEGFANPSPLVRPLRGDTAAPQASPDCVCYSTISFSMGSTAKSEYRGYCPNPFHRAIAPAPLSNFVSTQYRNAVFHDVIQVRDVPGLDWKFEDKIWAWQNPLTTSLRHDWQSTVGPPTQQKLIPPPPPPARNSFQAVNLDSSVLAGLLNISATQNVDIYVGTSADDENYDGEEEMADHIFD